MRRLTSLALTRIIYVYIFNIYIYRIFIICFYREYPIRTDVIKFDQISLKLTTLNHSVKSL